MVDAGATSTTVVTGATPTNPADDQQPTGEQQQQTGEWKDALPASIRDNPIVAEAPDVTTLAQIAIDAKSALGQGIRIPSNEAGQEDWDQFHQKLREKVPGLIPTPDASDPEKIETVLAALGKPGKAEEYRVPEIDAQGIELNMDMVDSFRPIAHKHGLSQKQFDGVVKEMMQQTVDQGLAMQQASVEQHKALQDEWGLAYNKRLAAAANTAKRTGAPPALVEALETGKLNMIGTDTLRWLYTLSESLGGEASAVASDQTAEHSISPDEAKLRADEVRKSLMGMSPSDPLYKAKLAQLVRYTAASNPGK